jgi:hypothetical protein
MSIVFLCGTAGGGFAFWGCGRFSGFATAARACAFAADFFAPPFDGVASVFAEDLFFAGVAVAFFAFGAAVLAFAARFFAAMTTPEAITTLGRALAADPTRRRYAQPPELEEVEDEPPLDGLPSEPAAGGAGTPHFHVASDSKPPHTTHEAPQSTWDRVLGASIGCAVLCRLHMTHGAGEAVAC